MNNQQIISTQSLALFSSHRVPGSLVLKTFDIMAALRDANVIVVSGFHSHMEKECLRTLLRGTQPVIVCPARSIKGYHCPAEWKLPIKEGRLILLSNFPDNIRRVTVETSERRNRFVVDRANAVFIPYAAPRSKTESLAKEIASLQKPLYTLIHDLNINLMNIGARSIEEFTPLSRA